MKIRLTALVGLALGLGVLPPTHLSAEDDKGLNVGVGDLAPVFESSDDQGKSWKSSEYVGKKVLVVYFFPADFTGGCTKQACGYRDDFQKFAEAGGMVVGISGDSARTHALFKKEHKLPFTLLTDENGEIAKKFGVPTRPGGEVKVKVDGKDEVLKRGVTASLWTFVIGKDGKIAFKNVKVNAGEDSKQIVQFIEKMGR
jgi:peroxiredoxin Q/BCP